MDLANQIQEHLQADSRTRHRRIQVVQRGGEIFLDGLVHSYYQKQMVQEIALRIIRSHVEGNGHSKNGNGNHKNGKNGNGNHSNGNGHIDLRVRISVEYQK